MTLKSIARKIANATGISYTDALAQVRAAVIDLKIERTGYHTELRSWMISSTEGRMLGDMIIEHAA
mgnify:FL=1